MSECQRCDRPVQDARVCTLCGRDLERALGNVPMLAEELNLTITKQRRFTPQSDGGRSSETPLAFHDKASEVYWTLRNILVSWVKFYIEETAPDAPSEGPSCVACLHISCSAIRFQRKPWPDDTLASMSRFLMGRVEWLRHHELALDAVDEITDAVRDAAHVIDAPANRTTFTVGPCPELDEYAAHCTGEVRAYIPSSEGVMAWMACSECGHKWDTTQWLRAGKRIRDRHAEVRNARVVDIHAVT